MYNIYYVLENKSFIVKCILLFLDGFRFRFRFKVEVEEIYKTETIIQ